MLQKIAQSVPVPSVLGFVLGIIAAVIGLLFSWNITIVFAVLFVLAWFWGGISEYGSGLLEQFFPFSLLMWLGYLPIYLISLLFG